MREEVQGELHPRTQQARRVYTELVERIRTAGMGNDLFWAMIYFGFELSRVSPIVLWISTIFLL